MYMYSRYKNNIITILKIIIIEIVLNVLCYSKANQERWQSSRNIHILCFIIISQSYCHSTHGCYRNEYYTNISALLNTIHPNIHCSILTQTAYTSYDFIIYSIIYSIYSIIITCVHTYNKVLTYYLYNMI